MSYQSYTNLAGLPGYLADQVSFSEAVNLTSLNQFIPLDETSKKLYVKIKNLDKNANQLSDAQKYSLSSFIQFGSPTTKRLGSGERAGVVNSYLTAFGALPRTVYDWQDVIKIASGRWPAKKSQSAEETAVKNFKRIYRRAPDLKNAYDSNAIKIAAYGLAPVRRVMNNETKALNNTFKPVFGHTPSSAAEWNILRMISYSGSKMK